MRKLCPFILGCLCLLAIATGLPAQTFQLLDDTTVSGELIVPGTADGVNIKLPNNTYRRIPWAQFTQESLQELAKNPRLAPFAEPLIEESEDERIRRTEVVINPIPRLEQPANPGIIGGLFSSSVGLVALLLLYLANLYAAYELSIVRNYPALLVCGLAAVVPVVVPIIFLCLPTRVASAAVAEEAEMAGDLPAEAHGDAAAGHAAGAAPSGHLTLASTATAAASPKLPEPQHFKRGQFTFNRRFIETKFPGFFGLARRDADKDLVIVIKGARGTHEAHRITRITANDMHVEVRKGGATSEVQVAFAEIQELILKHKDA